TESDPIFVAAPAYGITDDDISNWDAAGGDETDPVYSAWDKSSGISITESQISDFGSYETVFSKNTAFNKDFGAAAGTVAEGNDSRIVNGQTAYSWGDHSTVGYLTTESNNTLDKAYDQGGAGSGNTITADAGALTIDGTDGIISTGSVTSGTALAVSGAGTRLIWYPKKSAFRAGFVSGTEWDEANIGYYTTALGYKVSATADYSTAIGNTATASGEYATAIGYKITASGPNSTALGNYVSTGSVNGSFAIGDNSTTSVMTTSTANQMNMRFNGGYNLYSNAAADVGVFLAANGNSWSSISDSTKKENIISADGEYFLSSISKMKIGSWNYKAQNSKIRHYGPMAQDIFYYFGNDGVGIIGNDTTLSSADIDGIMMISIKALEKRTQNTTELNNRVTELEVSLDKLTAKLDEQTALIKAQQELLEAYRKELEDLK
ncbi:MAG: tail fiber domain-containing protein, partial [Bacteroidales bacterium]|nr:tail fiber domain-containing protein [Bacteroidales bacterium]